MASGSTRVTTSEGTRRSTLEQERSQRTRASLVDAADRLWSEHGFDAVKVSDLCAKAGVSKGLYYFYFATKEDLLVEFLLCDADEVATAVDAAIADGIATEQIFERAVAVMVRRTQQRPRHLLARGIVEWFGAIDRHDSLAADHTPLHVTLAAVFGQARARGEIGEGYSNEELGSLLEWALLRAALEWATATNRQPSLAKRLWSRVELINKGAAA